MGAKEPDEWDGFRRALSAVGVVGFVWALAGGIMLLFFSDERAARMGQFGDWFGAINALFASVAAAGAVFAVYLQMKESKAARLDRKKDEEVRDREEAVRMNLIFIDNFQTLKGRLEAERDKTKQAIEALKKLIGKLPAGHPNQATQKAKIDKLQERDHKLKMENRRLTDLIGVATGALHDEWQKVNPRLAADVSEIINKKY